jgi:Flp pilus assembly protein TadG
VEFALVIPIMLTLLAGMIDFGIGLYRYMTIINAARDGARYASLNCGTNTPACSSNVISRTTTATQGIGATVPQPVCKNAAGTVVTCDSGSARDGGSVTVTVNYTYPMIWPLAFGNTIPMGASSTFMVK